MKLLQLTTLCCAAVLFACDEAAPVEVAGAAAQAPRGAPLRAAVEAPATADGGAAQAAIAAQDALPPFARAIEAKQAASGDFHYDEYEQLPFSRFREMEYDLDPPAEGPELARPQQIPEDLLALHGKKVAIEGFMQPLDFDKGGVKSFALVGDQLACCFGMMPKMNEWVDVVMEGESRAGFYSYDPITVYGTLDVGEKIEDGYVVSLFRLTAQRVDSTY